MDELISAYMDAQKNEFIALANKIFEYAELANEERLSSQCLAAFLEANGFEIKWNMGHLATAFRAEWGNGGPVIGFLAEYDALPGLGQKPVPYPSGNNGNGHGCGHNLLGAGAVAAAMAVKYVLEQQDLKGTVVLYGCPAEEELTGKIEMAKFGCFKELDLALTWHPADINRVCEISYQAMDSVKFRFRGRTAHAAGAPHLGRSALDAAELMNVGCNYLREHVPADVRIHYSYLSAGEKPNIVPNFAEVWYYIRAKDRATVDETTKRVIKVAEGATLMTETGFELEKVAGGPETLVNFTLCDILYQAMAGTKKPEYEDDEMEFAVEINKHLNGNESKTALFKGVIPLTGKVEYAPGSTDLSEVSQIVPTAMINTVCAVTGTPGHHWAVTAASGMSIGHKGMLFAAEVIAKAGLRLIKEPDILVKVKKEFKKPRK
jgi:aminobenzoyl-glutamate utilization protein B